MRIWTANGCRYRVEPGYQRVEIPMPAFGKARPRVTVKGTFMPESYQQSRRTLRALFGTVTVEPPWIVRVTAVRRMPSSWSRKKRDETDGMWCLTKPDIDNILGGVLDALFDEDAAVVSISGDKQWGEAHLLAIEVMTAGERP